MLNIAMSLLIWKVPLGSWHALSMNNPQVIDGIVYKGPRNQVHCNNYDNLWQNIEPIFGIRRVLYKL